MDEKTQEHGMRRVDDMPEPVDYESIGKLMKRVRTERGMTQEQIVRDEIPNFIDRSVYAKYELGKARPSKEFIEAFANHFNLNLSELLEKVSIAIPDTCALLKSRRLLKMLLEDYSQVVVPKTVYDELIYIKNNGSRTENEGPNNKRIAWQVISDIGFYKTHYSDRFRIEDNNRFHVSQSTRRIENDLKVIELARSLKGREIADVVIITDDVDITTSYDGAILVYEYIAKRSKSPKSYDVILDLEKEYDHLDYYERISSELDLNAFLPDGMTLLINCIIDENWKEFKGVSKGKLRGKLIWLLDHGVDLNKNDSGPYCFPPLTHCVQAGNDEAFNLLINRGCDYNKCSQDETTYSHMKSGKLNEGNTALMLACWHGRERMARMLCNLEGICLNQQDSNGYTALIKCAVQRYNRKKAGKSYETQERLYRFLIEKGADQTIRDRENRTAADWWLMGDQLGEG